MYSAHCFQLDLFPPTLATRSVGYNSHVCFDGVHYSAPHHLVKSPVFVRAYKSYIDILDASGQCVASHKRSFKKHSYVTDVSHMPVFYPSIVDGTSYDGAMFRKWAKAIGDDAFELIDLLLSSRFVEEHTYKSCMAILQLSRRFGAGRLNTACRLALNDGKFGFYSVRKFLHPFPYTFSPDLDVPVSSACNHYDAGRNDDVSVASVSDAAASIGTDSLGVIGTDSLGDKSNGSVGDEVIS